jgi:hypothetical protein
LGGNPNSSLDFESSDSLISIETSNQDFGSSGILSHNQEEEDVSMPNNSSVGDQHSTSIDDESQNLSNLVKDLGGQKAEKSVENIDDDEDKTGSNDIGDDSEDDVDDDEEKSRENSNATPTEVFSVAASCLT